MANNKPTPMPCPVSTRCSSPPLSAVSIDLSADTLISIIILQLPSLTTAPSFLQSINTQPLFKQGEPSENVTILLECVEFADPSSLDFDDDNKGPTWSHYQFTAGGISPLSSLTTWQDIGSVTIAFRLVAAVLKMCQEVQVMCASAGVSMTGGYLSDVYLEQILERLESCWVGAGGTIASCRVPVLPNTPSYCNVVMSPPRLTIRFECMSPIKDIMATCTVEAPTGAPFTPQEHITGTGLMHGHSVAFNEDHVDVTSLKLLQNLELQAWIVNNKLPSPKSRCKDNLIAAILNNLGSVQLTKLAVNEIVERHKQKKGSTKLLSAIVVL